MNTVQERERERELTPDLAVTIAQELYNLTQQILLHSQTLFADLFPFFLVVTFFRTLK